MGNCVSNDNTANTSEAKATGSKPVPKTTKAQEAEQEVQVVSETAAAAPEEEKKEASPKAAAAAPLPKISAADLAIMFDDARSFQNYDPSFKVSDEDLKAIYDTVKWGPTAFNASPARFYFVRSEEAKAKLNSCLMPLNVEKTTQASVCVIVGYDTSFPETFKELSPHYDAKAIFDANPSWVEPTAVRNARLQGGYLILAARAHGLDAGGMSGFDNGAVDAAFFAGTTIKSEFLINIGKGVKETLYPRAPRLAFEDACKQL
jgi:3-hydroxypropanoate dehydrogenase